VTQRPWRLALSVQASLVQAAWTGVRLMLGYRALALGADPFFLGLLASSMALPALLAALPAGRLTDRVGGSMVASTGMLIAATGTTAAFALPGLWTLVAAAACIGFGQILTGVGQQTFVAHVSSSHSSDAAFGTLTAAASIGQLVGPPTVTTLSSLAIFGGQTSPNTTVVLIACVALILLATPAYFVIRPTDRALKPPDP
jgi:MFS family permease